MKLSGSTWSACADLSGALAPLPTFSRYAATLHSATGRVGPGPGFLPSVARTLSSLGSWSGHLWLLGYLTEGDPLWDLERTHEGRRFVEDAVHVSNAGMVLVSWFRARLRAYPYAHLPQLVPGTHHTTMEFTDQLRWRPRRETNPLQFVDFPGPVGAELGADASQAKVLRDAAVALLACIDQEPAVQKFVERRKALDSEALGALGECRSQLLASLATIDQHESGLAIPRHQFRATVTRDAVATLQGPAREYAQAFDTLDESLTMALANVIPMLAVHGPLTALGPLTELAVDASEGVNIEATVTPTDENPFPRVCRVYDIRNSGFDDPVFITGHSMNFSPTMGTIDRIRGEILEGASVLLP